MCSMSNICALIVCFPHTARACVRSSVTEPFYLISGFVLLWRAGVQSNILTCTYSTPYPVPDGGGYYLYNGVNFSFHCDYALNVDLEVYYIYRIEEGQSEGVWNGFANGFSAGTCGESWSNRCPGATIVLPDRSGSFNLTVTSYDSAVDSTQYRCFLSTTQPDPGAYFTINMTGRASDKRRVREQ